MLGKKRPKVLITLNTYVPKYRNSILIRHLFYDYSYFLGDNV